MRACQNVGVAHRNLALVHDQTFPPPERLARKTRLLLGQTLLKLNEILLIILLAVYQILEQWYQIWMNGSKLKTCVC